MNTARNLTMLAVAAAVAVALSAGPAGAAMMDLTAPTDAVLLVDGSNDGDTNSGSPPANEGVGNAIDNTLAKYLNFKDLGSGLIVTLSVGAREVTGLRVYTANDAEERDPNSYVLEGTNDDVSGTPTWTLISDGDLDLPAGRNNTQSDAVTLSHYHDEVLFANTTAYASYRLTFPTLKDAGAANSMQIGEIELLPEPATLAVLGLGAVPLLLRRRRRT